MNVNIKRSFGWMILALTAMSAMTVLATSTLVGGNNSSSGNSASQDAPGRKPNRNPNGPESSDDDPNVRPGDEFGPKSDLRNLPPRRCKFDRKCPCNQESVGGACVVLQLSGGTTSSATGGLPTGLGVFGGFDSTNPFGAESLTPTVGGYSFQSGSNSVLADGVTPSEITLTTPEGENVRFAFRSGSAVADASKNSASGSGSRITMVDVSGSPVTENPAYWDLDTADGQRIRYQASNADGQRGNLVSITDKSGKTVTAADMGIEVIRNSDGVRQFLTDSRLMDVNVVADGYDVSVYAVESTPRKIVSGELFELPASQPVGRISVRRSDNDRTAVVTQESGSSSRTFVYEYAENDWSITYPDGHRLARSLDMREEVGATRVSRTVDPDGISVKKVTESYGWLEGQYVLTNVTETSGSVSRRTEYVYNRDGGSKGRVSTKTDNRGLSETYLYDDYGRMTRKTLTGDDVPTETYDYSYASLDSSDVVLVSDSRPRTTVHRIAGVEVERFYDVYGTDSMINERAGEQGAAFGAAGSLRKVTTYYPQSAVLCGGMTKTVRAEGGELDSYVYASEDGNWVETVTHLHADCLTPVSGRTTRDVTVVNGRGQLVESRTEAYVDGVWTVVARERMTYDAQGHEVSRTDLAGRVTTTAWDCCHRISETQPDLSSVSWEYDEDGRVTAESRLLPLNDHEVTWVTTCKEYDLDGNVTAVWSVNRSTGDSTPVERRTYDGFGRVTSSVNPAKGTTRTSYSEDERVVCTTSPKGATTIVTCNAAGEMVSITGTADAPTYYTHGTLADGTRWTKICRGSTGSPRYTKQYFNMLGQLIREEKSGFQGAVAVTEYVYDGYGRLINSSDAGRTMAVFAYDDLGYCYRKTTCASGQWVRSTYAPGFEMRDGSVWMTQTGSHDSSSSALAALTTSKSVRLTGFTGGLWAQSEETDFRGNVIEYREEFENNVLTRITRLPGVSREARTSVAFAAQISEASETGSGSTRFYDHLGRPSVITDANGGTQYLYYDSCGRLSSMRDSKNRTTNYRYNQYGELVSVTDPIGNTVDYRYDIRGRRVYQGGATVPVEFGYDDFNQLVSRKTFRNEAAGIGDTVGFVRDAASGLVSARVLPDGNTQTYTYNAYGQITGRVWARGVTTTYTYNAWGDQTGVTYSDSTPSITVSYDAMGRKTSAVDAAGTTTFQYDQYNSLVRESVTDAQRTVVFVHRYDGYGRYIGYSRDGIVMPTVTYDAETGRIASLKPWGMSSGSFVWGYDGDYVSSVSCPNTAVTIQIARDEFGDVSSCNAMWGRSLISGHSYTYDRARRTASVSDSGSAFAQSRARYLDYDVRGRLASASDSVNPSNPCQYVYDDAGNRVSATEGGITTGYTTVQGNRYSSVGGFTPTYDADGNQTTVKTSTGVWSVEYNAENRPVRWTQGDQVITMSYDRLGRRVTKNGRRFYYDGYRLVYDSFGNAYVWDPTASDVDRPIAWILAGSVYSYVHDRDSNVREVFASGKVPVAHYEYSPFGGTITATGTMAASNPWRFSSAYSDDETGTVYYNFRHYNPLDGRWMSRDPYWKSDDFNGYVMCGNRAYGCVDRLGLWGSYFPQNDHGKFTKEGVRRAAANVSCLKNNPDLLKEVTKAINDGNHFMDSSKQYSKSDDENLPLHYNRNKATGQSAADAQRRYKEGLGERRNNIANDLNGAQSNVEQCMNALEQLGELTHMLQDYFGHGVNWDYTVEKKTIEYEVWYYKTYIATEYRKVEHGDIGDTFGGPDTPDADGNDETENRDQMKPSNYSEGDVYTEHGIWTNTSEPGRRARAHDVAARKEASIAVTAAEAEKWLKKWCDKCCKSIEEYKRKTAPLPGANVHL